LSIKDKTYLDQHFSKVAGDSKLTYSQQLYGFRNDHELIAHAWGYFPDLEFTYSKEGSLLSLVAGKPLSWFLQVPA
jgi:hypothetical protein